MLYATERQTLCTGLRVCPRVNVNPAEPGRGRGDNAQITDSLKLGTNVRHQELTYVAENGKNDVGGLLIIHQMG